MSLRDTLGWLEAVDLSEHPQVESCARLLLLDTLACAVRAAAEPELTQLAERLSTSSPGAVAWPGVEHKFTSSDASFWITVAACWYEACEGLASAHGRPGLHAVPVALSMGLSSGGSLKEVLDAIVFGYEIGSRMGQSMRIRAGMHVDGTWGLIASTATACRLLKADQGQCMAALAMAASQMPCSLYEPISAGCTARNTYAAHASSLGILLAQSALSGITAPDSSFEIAKEILMSNKSTPFSDGAAQHFYITDGYLKPFAAVRHVHYAADCALQWHQTHNGADTASITDIHLETYEEALTYCGNSQPSSAIEAQFSLSYGTAFALRTGGLGPEAYDTQALTDPKQFELEKLVRVSVDPAMTARGARLIVTSNRTEEIFESRNILGDPGNPMTRDDVETKANDYMSGSLGTQSARRIVSLVLDGDLNQSFSWP